MKSFASDNYSGVSDDIFKAIQEANDGHASSYGNDIYTAKAITLFKEVFGEEVNVFFVNNGTAANSLSLKAMTRSHHSIMCADCSHIANQEVGAPHHMTGCAFKLVPNSDGKMNAHEIEASYLDSAFWGQHSSLPKVISITQPTEYGTVYSINELKDIATLCKKYNLLFHMDGSRLANAAVSLQVSLKEITADVGVDVLSFGGTKNGLMFGEAIVFFRKELANEFEYIQKQGMQLQSKMRFLSAQYIPYLEKNIWKRNAAHANAMATNLANALSKMDFIKFAYPVQTNQLFAYFPESIIEATQPELHYYLWDNKPNLVRLVTSFDTTTADINHCIRLIEKAYRL